MPIKDFSVKIFHKTLCNRCFNRSDAPSGLFEIEPVNVAAGNWSVRSSFQKAIISPAERKDGSHRIKATATQVM